MTTLNETIGCTPLRIDDAPRSSAWSMMEGHSIASDGDCQLVSESSSWHTVQILTKKHSASTVLMSQYLFLVLLAVFLRLTAANLVAPTAVVSACMGTCISSEDEEDQPTQQRQGLQRGKVFADNFDERDLLHSYRAIQFEFDKRLFAHPTGESCRR
jgi:hypothetical protein